MQGVEALLAPVQLGLALLNLRLQVLLVFLHVGRVLLHLDHVVFDLLDRLLHRRLDLVQVHVAVDRGVARHLQLGLPLEPVEDLCPGQRDLARKLACELRVKGLGPQVEAVQLRVLVILLGGLRRGLVQD